MQKDIYVNIGRVVSITFGPLSGKLAVIVDLVNATKVVIDGPSLDVPRTVISNKRISLTPFSISGVTAATPATELEKMIKAFGVQERFAKSGAGRRLAKQERRAALTDFERFKVYIYKKKLGNVLRTRVNARRAELRQSAKTAKK